MEPNEKEIDLLSDSRLVGLHDQLQQQIRLLCVVDEPEDKERLITYLIDDLCLKQGIQLPIEPRKALITALLSQEQMSLFQPSIDTYTPPLEFVGRTITEKIYTQANIILGDIYMDLLRRMDLESASKMGKDGLMFLMSEHLTPILDARKIHLNALERMVLEHLVIDEMLGLGPLELLLIDDSVSDILVNRFNKIYVERFGVLSECFLTFRDETHLMHVINRLIAASDKHVDLTMPFVDTHLEDGSRVNVIIKPLAVDSPVLSIRKFNKKRLSLSQMVLNSVMSPEMASFLTLAVYCRLNIMISGGTGTGKTTLLNALSQAILSSERIITIEDAIELQLHQEHVVRLETRTASIEGTGVVTQRDLLRNALRMRPDRIILGEVRGSEAFDLLQAMNTGHEGSLSTIHANSVEEVPMRLSNMIAISGIGIDPADSLKQIGRTLDLVVQVARFRDGKRYVTHIDEMGLTVDQRIIINPLFAFEHSTSNMGGAIQGEHRYIARDLLCASVFKEYGVDGLWNNLSSTLTGGPRE